MFTYHVGAELHGNLVLTIADEGGKDLCRMDVPEASETSGVHRVTWNLRVTRPHKPAVVAAAVGAAAVGAADEAAAGRSRARRSHGRGRQRGGATSRRRPRWRWLRRPWRRRTHGVIRAVHGDARSSRRRQGRARWEAAKLPGRAVARQELVGGVALGYWVLGYWVIGRPLRALSQAQIAVD